MKNKVIMGIDPGLRNLGVAILSPRGRLLAAQVLTSRDEKSAFHRRKRLWAEIDELLRRYRPSIVVLEKTWPTQHASLTQVRKVALMCRKKVTQRRISVTEVPVSTVRKVVAGYGWATKTETAQVIAALYPELQLYLRQTRAWKTRHFQNLFDAVAVALWYRKTHFKPSK